MPFYSKNPYFVTFMNTKIQKSSFMKRILSISFAALCLLASCNNNKPKDATIVSEDGKSKVTIDANEMTKTADEMTNKIEELKKLPHPFNGRIKGHDP